MLNALLPNKQYHEIIENYNSCLMKPFNSIIKEPLDGYLRKSFSWHLFHLIFGFSTKSLHVKNYCGETVLASSTNHGEEINDRNEKRQV